MTIFLSLFGSVDLPNMDDARPPRDKPDGVRVVRRPLPRRGART